MVFLCLPHAAQNLGAVHLGHQIIQKDQVHLVFFQILKGGFSGTDQRHSIKLGKVRFDLKELLRIIIHNEDLPLFGYLIQVGVRVYEFLHHIAKAIPLCLYLLLDLTELAVESKKRYRPRQKIHFLELRIPHEDLGILLIGNYDERDPIRVRAFSQNIIHLDRILRLVSKTDNDHMRHLDRNHLKQLLFACRTL